MGKTYTIVIEKDEDGMLIGRAVGLKGCVTQGENMDELMNNMREAIELYLQESPRKKGPKFVGVQQIEVA